MDTAHYVCAYAYSVIIDDVYCTYYYELYRMQFKVDFIKNSCWWFLMKKKRREKRIWTFISVDLTCHDSFDSISQCVWRIWTIFDLYIWWENESIVCWLLDMNIYIYVSMMGIETRWYTNSILDDMCMTIDFNIIAILFVLEIYTHLRSSTMRFY